MRRNQHAVQRDLSTRDENKKAASRLGNERREIRALEILAAGQRPCGRCRHETDADPPFTPEEAAGILAAAWHLKRAGAVRPLDVLLRATLATEEYGTRLDVEGGQPSPEKFDSAILRWARETADRVSMNPDFLDAPEVRGWIRQRRAERVEIPKGRLWIDELADAFANIQTAGSPGRPYSERYIFARAYVQRRWHTQLLKAADAHVPETLKSCSQIEEALESLPLVIPRDNRDFFLPSLPACQLRVIPKLAKHLLRARAKRGSHDGDLAQEAIRWLFEEWHENEHWRARADLLGLDDEAQFERHCRDSWKELLAD